MKSRRGADFWLPLCLLGVFLSIVLFAPLASLIGIPFDNGERIATSKSSGVLFATTLTLSLSTTLLATVLGVLAGIALFVLPARVRDLLFFASMSALFVPSYVYAIAWIEILGRHGELSTFLNKLHFPTLGLEQLFSLPGCITLLSLVHYPIVMWLTLVACTRIDAEKIDTARTEGSMWAIILHVLLPHSAPFVATGSLVVFLLSLTTYALPSLFQVSTYSVEIFSMYNAFHDPYNGVLQTVPVIVMAFLAIAIWWAWAGRRLVDSAFLPLNHRFIAPSSFVSLLALLGVGSLLLIAIGLPVGTLIGRVSFPESLIEAFTVTRAEWQSSLLLATSATFVVLGMTSVGVFLLEGANRFLTLSLICASAIPYLISGPAWGIGLVNFWNQEGWRGFVYDHSSIALIACVGKYSFIGWIGFSIAIRGVRDEYLETARVFGLSRWRQFVTVIMPATKSHMAAIGGVVFLLVLGEVDSLLLVTPPGFVTLPVRMYGLIHYGPSELTASMAVIIFFFVGSIGLLMAIFKGMFDYLNRRTASNR